MFTYKYLQVYGICALANTFSGRGKWKASLECHESDKGCTLTFLV